MITLARFAPFFLANALFRICAFALIIVFLDWWSVIPFALLLLLNLVRHCIISSVRSSNSHPDLLVITSTTTTTPLFQITPVLNTGLSLSEPLQLYKGYNAI